jgi:hypothetical protein
MGTTPEKTMPMSKKTMSMPKDIVPMTKRMTSKQSVSKTTTEKSMRMNSLSMT